jgi:fucose permease
MTESVRSADGWRSGYFIIGAAQLSLALVFLLTLKLWDAVPTRPIEASNSTAGAPGPTPATPAYSEAGWWSAVIFAIYVGIEGTAGLWAASILVEARGVPLAAAGACTTIYYGSITTGRVLVGFVVDRWGARRLVTVGTLIALAGALMFTQAGSALVAGIALVLLGVGFAPVYPCLMHEVPRRFAPSAVQTVIGRQSGASYIGGAFMPPVIGWLAQAVSLDAVVWVVVGGVIALFAIIRRLDRLT